MRNVVHCDIYFIKLKCFIPSFFIVVFLPFD